MQAFSAIPKPPLLLAAVTTVLLLNAFHATTADPNTNADGAVVSRTARQASRPGCNCVPLRECPRLINLIRTRNPQVASILRQALCGFQNGQPRMCCPRGSTGTSPVFPSEPKVQLPTRCGDPPVFDRIFGGDFAYTGQFPWMALLGYSEPGSRSISFMCGGSIITDRYILTASHCNDRTLTRRKVLSVVRLGEHKISTNPDCEMLQNNNEHCNSPYEDFGIERFIPHPDYGRPLRVSNDVALLRVDRRIDFGTYIRPVCLPPPDLRTEDLSTTSLTVAGWGSTENSSQSDSLLFVTVPYVDQKTCNNSYEGIIQDSQICAGGEPGRDSCRGDSGGPLIRQTSKKGPPFQQIGIVSFGNRVGCGSPEVPGVYASVLAYRSWIVSNLRP